jgi:hypothetical protein
LGFITYVSGSCTLKSIKGLKEITKRTKRKGKPNAKKKKNTDEVAFGMLYGAQNIVFFV